MRILLLIICIISLSKSTYGQHNIDCAYIHAILYFKTNEYINSEIKRVFSNTIKIKRKEKIVDFRVREEVVFMNISGFSDEKNKKMNALIEDKDLLNDSGMYAEKYGFDTYKEELLGKLVPPTTSELVLVFSKPTNNYLIAIMLDSKLSNNGESLIGKSIMFLFIFDENKFVKDIVLTYPYIH